MVEWMRRWAFVISAVSLAFAVFTYLANQQTRRLRYAADDHWSRTVILRADQPGGLDCHFAGLPLSGQSVVGVNVLLWNAGTAAIRPDNLLKPIEIHVEGARILQAALRKQSSEVVGFSIPLTPADPSWAEGRVPVQWKILERGDGALLQLVYSGAPNASITLGGQVEGQIPIQHVEGMMVTGTRLPLLMGLLVSLVMAPTMFAVWYFAWNAEQAGSRVVWMLVRAFSTVALLVMASTPPLFLVLLVRELLLNAAPAASLLP